MDNDLDRFWADAKALRLDTVESATFRKTLQNAMSGGFVSLSAPARLQDSMKPSDSFLQRAKAASLDADAKMQVKIRLRSFMQKHPAGGKPVTLARWSLLWLRFAAITTGLCLIAVGGGAVYAAESAEPGEALYIMKRYLNEPVMIALAFDAETKASAHSRILQRRLREIETLVLSGEMSADGKRDEDIRANLEYHLAAARASITLLSQEHPEAAAAENARVEAELDAHITVLSALAGTSAPDIRPYLNKVTTAVSSAAKVATDTRTTYETIDEKASRISAEASLEQSERGLAEARRSLDRMHGIADERSLLRAKKKLAEAEDELSQGKKTLEAQGFSEAFEQVRLARRKAEESRVMAASDTEEDAAASSSTSLDTQREEESLLP